MDYTEIDLDYDQIQEPDSDSQQNTWLTSDDISSAPQQVSGSDELAEPNYYAESTDSDSEDVLSAYLKNQGIPNPAKIKFEDSTGLIKERNWNDLTGDEQYNILTSLHEDPERELSSDEIDLINKIRLSNLSPRQYISSLQPAFDMPSQQFDFDQVPDEDLFIMDLQNRVGLSDEEAEQALEAAQADPDTFAKQVEGIRRTVAARQQENAQAQQMQFAANQERFKNQLLDQIEAFHQIGGLDIEMQDDDLNELANYVIPENGHSPLSQALSQPENIIKAAYFLKFGDRFISDVQDYVADQIKKARQAGYNQGIQEAGGGKKQANRVIVTPNTPDSGNEEPVSFLDINF